MVFRGKGKGGRINKSEWESLDASKLIRLMANRVARIEVLKMEIRELQKMIDRKMRE